MTAIIDNYLLSKMLRDGKSWEQISDFCSTRKQFCFGNKEEFCKKILKAKFKNVIKGSDYCGILKEFIDAKRLENTYKNTTGPQDTHFVVTKEFLTFLSSLKSNEFPKLRKFLAENGANVSGIPVILASNYSAVSPQNGMPTSPTGQEKTVWIPKPGQVGARMVKRKTKKISKKKK